MITNRRILKSFEEISHSLEESLRKVALDSQQQLVQDVCEENEGLSRLQDQLQQVRSFVEKVCLSIKSNNINSYCSIPFDSLFKICKDIADPSSFEDGDLQYVVSQAIFEYIILLCYYSVTNECVQGLPAVYEAEQYYKTVSDSTLKSFLYCLQTSVSTLRLLSKNVQKEINKKKLLKQTWSLKALSLDLLEQVRPTINKFMVVRNFRFVGLPKKPIELASLVSDIPRGVVHERLNIINQSSQEYTTKLGYLIAGFDQPSEKNEPYVSHQLNYERRLLSLQSFFGLSASDASLADVVRCSANFHRDHPLRTFTKPSVLTRYWPSILLCLWYGPSSIMTLWNSRYVIQDFIRNNIVDFAKGLVLNWLWSPLKQVWSTVRHDEGSAISVTSQETLNSDMDSLTRMIVSFVVDNSESASNHPIDPILLSTKVEQGDLTEFMEIYETQLHHPIKNIATGGLVRSLLIQLQKTKVDGSMALNGIDKMLKSQQLVFGVVALSPALVILYSFAVALKRFIKLGNVWSNIKRYKEQISMSLNNVERILNYSNQGADSNEEHLNQGLLVIEVSNLYKLGSFLVPHSRRKEWFRDVEELVDINLDSKAHINVVNRIYHVYGRFLIH
ncbi:nca2p [Saccharomyces arboricola H-6]|uniref:Nca2p n=1 Tax=Saccharomyces arboricola (strain H-6 / AS 2.3317 / CBS 10644) TaxID=1160507 RepID=J8Q0W8_SACAR|nr:nca2p [Saccharomyces arboricola H-6]